MPNHLSTLAHQLTQDLELSRPPVQISYLESPPHGVEEHPGGAPSVCTFFAEGQSKPFFARLAAHEACEIGAFVLGVEPKGDVGERLMATVGMMQQEGYLAKGEEAKIPRNATPPKVVAYGPLGSLEVPPTDVLIFAKPLSAMWAMEAAGGPVPMNGRPMCAIAPTLNQGAAVAVSMGCIGSRIYSKMGDENMVIGIRGDQLDAFAARLKKIKQANTVVGDEDARRKARYHPKP